MVHQSNRLNKRQTPLEVKDMTKLSNEELVNEFSSHSGYEEWVISAAEERYHSTHLESARVELFRRLNRS